MATKAGRPRISESELRWKNDARNELIFNSRYSNRVVKSQQTCTVRENRRKLENILAQTAVQGQLNDTSGNQTRNRINGLLSVWDMLTADAVEKDGKEHTSFFVAFDDALEVFYNSYEEINVKPPYLNTDKDRLLYALLNKQWGLCVYIVTDKDRDERFIVIRPDEVDMELFLDEICQKSEDNSPSRVYLDKTFVKSLLASMDSEWDKVVARVLIGIDRSTKQLENLGIDGREISRNVEKVIKKIVKM